MKHLLPALLLSTAITPALSHADIALGVHGGTPGLGLSMTFELSKQFNLRGVINQYDYNFDDSVDDIEYDLDLKLSSYGLLLDWYPGSSSFRLTIGAIANNNEIEGEANPSSGTVTIGDQSFSSALVGELQTDVSFDSFAPYLGIGWGNPVKSDGVHFTVDIGVMFQGEGDVDFRTVGTDASIQANVDAEIEREEKEIQDDLDDYKLYPIVAIGLSYRF